MFLFVPFLFRLHFSHEKIYSLPTDFPYNTKMRFIFILLSFTAALLTLLIIALTVLSLSTGGGSVLLPGLGIIISLPLVILLLIFVDAVIVLLALLFGRLDKKNNLYK